MAWKGIVLEKHCLPSLPVVELESPLLVSSEPHECFAVNFSSPFGHVGVCWRLHLIGALVMAVITSGVKASNGEWLSTSLLAGFLRHLYVPAVCYHRAPSPTLALDGELRGQLRFSEALSWHLWPPSLIHF